MNPAGSDPVEQAGQALLTFLRERGASIRGLELVKTITASGYIEHDVRAALWYLIDNGTVVLLKDRSISLNPDVI